MNDIPVLSCAKCGVLRQDVPMTQGQYAEFYKSRYYSGVYTHDEAEDDRTAALRVKAHGDRLRGRILDIGSGNGAFVRACRAAELEACGQDIAPVGPSDSTYCGALEDIGFPTDWADTVTLHDVLEHVVDPKAMLGEAARILKPGGHLIIDFPAFERAEARHHWKLIEHIWFLGQDQLVSLIEGCGFDILSVTGPIPGKIVVYAKRWADKRANILVPPGIGDVYWVLAKLRGFAKAHDIALPCDIWVDAPDGRRRSLGFVERVPFVKAAGYHDPPVPRRPDELMRQWHERVAAARKGGPRNEAYGADARHAFADVEGFDWFLAFNGSMNAGRSLVEIEPDWPVDWDIPIFLSLEDEQYGRQAVSDFGDYVVAAFFSRNFYAKWLKEMPPQALYDMLAKIADQAGVKIVLTGAGWDLRQHVNAALIELGRRNGRLVSLIGETTLGQYLGLLKHAAGCVGFPAGNTMMGPALDIPSMLIWNDHFERRFHFNACRPDRKYIAATTGDDPAALAASFLRIMR